MNFNFFKAATNTAHADWVLGTILGLGTGVLGIGSVVICGMTLAYCLSRCTYDEREEPLAEGDNYNTMGRHHF